jgi:hypothetical protein
VEALSCHSRSVRHEPDRVVRDVAVMLANSGDALTDLSALRDQPMLFGHMASGARSSTSTPRL